ncbi:hypothetical protein V8B97DRAFT_1916169 [Scleroderma yunnanense]
MWSSGSGIWQDLGGDGGLVRNEVSKIYDISHRIVAVFQFALFPTSIIKWQYELAVMWDGVVKHTARTNSGIDDPEARDKHLLVVILIQCQLPRWHIELYWWRSNRFVWSVRAVPKRRKVDDDDQSKNVLIAERLGDLIETLRSYFYTINKAISTVLSQGLAPGAPPAEADNTLLVPLALVHMARAKLLEIDKDNLSPSEIVILFTVFQENLGFAAGRQAWLEMGIRNATNKT